MALRRSSCAIFARIAISESRCSSGGAALRCQSSSVELPRRCPPAILMEAQRMLTSVALKPGPEMPRSICSGARAVAGLPSPAATDRCRLLVLRQPDSLKLGASAKRFFSSIPYRSCGVRAELAEEGWAPGQSGAPVSAPTPFPTSSPSPSFNSGPGANPGFNSGSAPSFNSGPGSNAGFNAGPGPSSSFGSGPIAGPGPVSEGANDTEPLWRAYFANPSGWWDDRAKKRSPSQPDFVRKGSRESLWIESPATPSWVAAELAKMPPPTAAPLRTGAAPGSRPSQGQAQGGYRPPYRDSNYVDPPPRPVPETGYGYAYVPPRRNPDATIMDPQPAATAASTAPPIDVTPNSSSSGEGDQAKPKKPLDPATQAHLDELRAPVDMERLKATMGKPISAWANYGKPESEHVNIPPPKPKEEVKARPKKPMSPETKAHLEALRAPVDMERLKATIGKPIEAWINYGKPESEWVHPPPPKPRVEKPKKPMSPETKAHLEALRAPVDMERLKATIGKPIEAWINYGKPESEWVHPPPPKPRVEKPKKPMSPETKAHLEALRGPVDMERLRATIGKPIEAWINYGKPESEWWHPPPPRDKDSMPPPRRRSVRSRSRPSSS